MTNIILGETLLCFPERFGKIEFEKSLFPLEAFKNCQISCLRYVKWKKKKKKTEITGELSFVNFELLISSANKGSLIFEKSNLGDRGSLCSSR